MGANKNKTVEEAAIESCVFDKSIYNVQYQPYYLDGFKAGSEWQERQSPWHECKEDTDDIPNIDSECLLRVEYKIDDENLTTYETSIWGTFGWTEDNLEYYKRNSQDWKITHWMYIPSFDEILEANKDVLQRMKEKGE